MATFCLQDKSVSIFFDHSVVKVLCVVVFLCSSQIYVLVFCFVFLT